MDEGDTGTDTPDNVVEMEQPTKIGDETVKLCARCEAIQGIIREIQRDTPGAVLVFGCEMGPHRLALGRCGDDIAQAGLLALMTSYITTPIAISILKSSEPRIVPAVGPIPSVR